MSPFWSDWSVSDSSVAALTKTTGQESVLDAVLVVKAGATSQGLYVWWSAADDSIVHGTWEAGRRQDQLRMQLDPLPAGDIQRCTDCLIGLFESGLTCASREIAVYAGLIVPDELVFGFGYCLAPLMSWDETPYADPGQLLAERGPIVEVVRLSDSTLVGELFLPWGAIGLLPGDALAGRRLAFCASYWDLDDVAGGLLKLASWTGQDVWMGAEYWGDLVLPAGVAPVESLLAVGLRSRSLPEESHGAEDLRYYTLTGQRLVTGGRASHAAIGVLVRRTSVGAGLLVAKP
jgi:hypothetical protein